MKGRPRILIVEDNVATRTMLEQTLDLEGFDVVSAPNGESVAGKLAGVLPNLVVLDVMMPGMDGFAVLQQIRANPRTQELPVVMLTALDDADSTWKGWRSGCNYYMNKPFEPDELLSAIRNLTGVAA